MHGVFDEPRATTSLVVCVSVGLAKKDVTVARKHKKHSLLSCCLATKTPDADCQEARDDVSVTSLEDHVRNTLDF